MERIRTALRFIGLMLVLQLVAVIRLNELFVNAIAGKPEVMAGHAVGGRQIVRFCCRLYFSLFNALKRPCAAYLHRHYPQLYRRLQVYLVPRR